MKVLQTHQSKIIQLVNGFFLDANLANVEVHLENELLGSFFMLHLRLTKESQEEGGYVLTEHNPLFTNFNIGCNKLKGTIDTWLVNIGLSQYSNGLSLAVHINKWAAEILRQPEKNFETRFA